MAQKRHRMAQRRRTVGLSQEQLAEAVGVDRSTVARWERADSDPQPWHRPRLAEILRLTVDELAELLADTHTAPPPGDERLDYALTHPGRVDLIAVAHLRERLQRLDEQYEHVPSTMLLAEAGQLHGQTSFLRQNAGPARVRRELWAAEAESAMLMGQLVWDASQRRDHTTATVYFDQAITAARHARDVVIEAYAELRKSYIALYGTGNPLAGLALARRAAGLAAHDSPVITGLATLHVAEAHARLGDIRQCDHALGDAETAFSEVEPDDPASLLYCPSQHARLAGSCWLHLGNPNRAESALDRAHQILQSRNKAAAIVLGNLALAAIQQRHIDTAATRLHQAIDVIEQTRSGGGLNIVFTAARELRPWRNEAAVQEVNDRLLTLMTTA